MTISTRVLGVSDWNAFWPLLLATGTDDTEATVKQRYDELAGDPRWVVIGAEVDDSLVGFAAIQDYGPHLRIGSIHRIARLHDLYVAPGVPRARRRQGVDGGRRGMDELARALPRVAGAPRAGRAVLREARLPRRGLSTAGLSDVRQGLRPA